MNAPSYIDNGDGTIADQVTGLMWQKAYKVMTYEEAVERIKTFNLANHMDWPVPTTIKNCIPYNAVQCGLCK